MNISEFKNIENIEAQRVFSPSILQFRKYKCKECGKRFTNAGRAKNHKCSTKYLKPREAKK
jgi:tRNA(Ile2) C34 agmatinyltransferase TiaS